jgi:hypothetical protein
LSDSPKSLSIMDILKFLRMSGRPVQNPRHAALFRAA